MAQNNQPIISIAHVSLRLNLAKEKQEGVVCFVVVSFVGRVGFHGVRYFLPAQDHFRRL